MFYNKLNGFIVAICLGLALATPAFAKPIQVVTVTEDFASITRSVGGDLVRVNVLIKGSRNLHLIVPKPSMVLSLRHADLIIRLGMNQDGWVDSLIHTAKNARLFPGKVGYLDASEGITKLEVPTGKIDGRMGDVHIEGNPHYTLNPQNGILIAKEIRDRLSQLDPKNKETYNKNYQQFSRKIQAKMRIWSQQLNEMPDTHFITYHKVWAYFFDAFSLKGLGEIEALPGIPPTTSHLIKLKQKVSAIKTRKIVLSTNYYPEHTGKHFAESIKAAYVRVSVNLGEESIDSYEGLFDYLVERIRR
tara:strand:+ start:332 stop:1240 length:909 start_codon:yes stop_codon:yes gene_type:complete